MPQAARSIPGGDDKGQDVPGASWPTSQARGGVKSLWQSGAGNRPVPHAEIFSIFVIFVVNNQNVISFHIQKKNIG